MAKKNILVTVSSAFFSNIYWIFEFLLKIGIFISVVGSVYLAYLVYDQNLELLRIYEKLFHLNSNQLQYQATHISTKNDYFWPAFPIAFFIITFIFFISRKFKKQFLDSIGYNPRYTRRAPRQKAAMQHPRQKVSKPITKSRASASQYQQQVNVQLSVAKHPGIAAVLSFMFVGLGQIYNGQILKGIIFIGIYIFSLFLIFVVIGLITTPLFWLYGIYDAYQEAEMMNRE